MALKLAGGPLSPVRFWADALCTYSGFYILEPNRDWKIYPPRFQRGSLLAHPFQPASNFAAFASPCPFFVSKWPPILVLKMRLIPLLPPFLRDLLLAIFSSLELPRGYKYDDIAERDFSSMGVRHRQMVLLRSLHNIGFGLLVTSFLIISISREIKRHLSILSLWLDVRWDSESSSKPFLNSNVWSPTVSDKLLCCRRELPQIYVFRWPLRLH